MVCLCIPDNSSQLVAYSLAIRPQVMKDIFNKSSTFLGQTHQYINDLVNH